ncbi:hypothetical protein BGZ98_008931 [Dissophora globulifera]|nr:hypothetical protein BGZ98_008931 [Dissophora globulifera]
MPAPKSLSNRRTATNATIPTSRSISTVTAAATSPSKSARKRANKPWTPEADTLLLELRMNHNKKWLEIGQQLEREPATCMTRFESTLNPTLKNFWTLERDKELDIMITASKTWAEIAQTLGVHRLACMERWRQLGLVGDPVQLDTAKKALESGRKTSARISQQSQQRQQQDAQVVQQRVQAQEQLIKVREMTTSLKSIERVDLDKDRLSWNSLLRDDQRYDHYRSWKKRSGLEEFSQMYLMNPGWSAKEETMLIQAVLKHGLDKWEIVAQQGLKGRFTAMQCRTCWKNLDMPVVSSLDQAKESSPPSTPSTSGNSTSGLNGTKPALLSASSLLPPGQDAKSVAIGILGYDDKSEWSEEQQVEFWHLWNHHGQDWGLISKLMGVSAVDCDAFFRDISSRLRHSSELGANTDRDLGLDDAKLQEHIRVLARKVTDNFTRVPQTSSVSRRRNRKTGKGITFVNGSDDGNSGGTPSDVGTTDAKSVTKLKSFAWDKELSVRLQAIVRQGYKSRAVHVDEINWMWVSRRVHPNATARICKNHWKYLYDQSHQVIWSHEDIKRLEEGIRLLGPRKLTPIRDHFLPHMSKDDIVRQWYRISDKATVIDEDEYYRLLGAVKELVVGDGGSLVNENDAYSQLEDPQSPYWSEVEKRMGTGWKRMPCKRIWESSFQHLIHHGNWTPHEDTLLLRIVKFVGRDDWFSVAKAMHSGRSPWQYRLRWCQLVDPVVLEAQDIFVGGEKYC